MEHLFRTRRKKEGVSGADEHGKGQMPTDGKKQGCFARAYARRRAGIPAPYGGVGIGARTREGLLKN